MDGDQLAHALTCSVCCRNRFWLHLKFLIMGFAFWYPVLTIFSFGVLISAEIDTRNSSINQIDVLTNSSIELGNETLSNDTVAELESDLSLDDDGNFLKETTKIVTIKIYPPPAKGGDKGGSELANVRIPQPFDVQTTTAIIPTLTTKKDELMLNISLESAGAGSRNGNGSVENGVFSGANLPAAKEVTVGKSFKDVVVQGRLCQDARIFL